MRTEELIEALARDVTPTRPARPAPGLLTAAGAVLLVVIALVPALRPDLGPLIAQPGFWLRAAYTAALATSALWLADRLGRPGASARPPFAALCTVLATAAVAALAEQAALDAPDRLAALMGQSWSICPPLIFAMSLAAAPVVFLGARRFAPTRPALMGAALGLMSGAAAAGFYSLHCPELTASFVAVWYTAGVLAAGFTGAVAGRVALRW